MACGTGSGLHHTHTHTHARTHTHAHTHAHAHTYTHIQARDLHDVVKPGALLTAVNLTYRGVDHTHNIPTATAGDCTLFSQRPRESYLKEALEQLRQNLPVSLKLKHVKNPLSRVQLGFHLMGLSGRVENVLGFIFLVGIGSVISGRVRTVLYNQLSVDQLILHHAHDKGSLNQFEL